jgi:hypothetical protein
MPSEHHFRPEQRAAIKELAAKLNGAFFWEATPQGAKYWGKVAENLFALAKDPPVCPTCGQEKP